MKHSGSMIFTSTLVTILVGLGVMSIRLARGNVGDENLLSLSMELR